MGKKKFYAVAKGHKPGIYSTWYEFASEPLNSTHDLDTFYLPEFCPSLAGMSVKRRSMDSLATFTLVLRHWPKLKRT